MAIEMFEGFDTFSISQVSRRGYTFAAGQYSTMITGRYGVGQALQLNTFTGSAYCKFQVTGRSEYYGGFDFNTSNANITLMTIMNTSGSTITTFGVGSSNTVLTSTFGNSPTFTLFPGGQWQNLQWHLVISATVGVLQVYVDGILAINLSSLNTGTVNIGYIELENSYGGNSFDNFWVMNTTGSHSNTWPTGRMTVQATYPNADDSPLQWTPDSSESGIIRGSGIQSSYTDSYTIPWPSGTLEDDLAIIAVSNGYDVDLPSGWTSLYNNGVGPAFISGLIASKVLNSTDISTGSVTVTIANAYDGVAMIVTMEGALTIRETDTDYSSGTTDSITTSGAVASGDTALYFGMGRTGGADTISVNRGSDLQNSTDGNFCGCIYAENIMAGGAVTPTFSFTSNAHFVDAIVILETGVTHYTRINEAVCDDDSSYVYATNANFQDTFTVGSLNAAYASTASTITQVHSVMVSAQNKRDASPTKQMQVLAISGGTTVNTSTITSPTTYTSTVLQMNDDPNTSAQWTTSAVNALKPAIEVIS